MNPIKFSTDSKLVIDVYEGLPITQQFSDYWSDDAVTPIKREIKDHYIVEQNYYCPYCRRQNLTDNHGAWHAEHIICRYVDSRFMFTSYNLVVSCVDCNTAKGTKDVRANKRLKRFPMKSDHYNIIHPHFDDYDKELMWIGDLCSPLSTKGSNTVVMCNLTRFAAKKIGLKGIIVDPTMNKLVGNIYDSGNKDPALLNAEMAALTKYVETIPQLDRG